MNKKCLMIYNYIHHNSTMQSMIKLKCYIKGNQNVNIDGGLFNIKLLRFIKIDTNTFFLGF